MDKNTDFSFTYSAAVNKEVREIRKKYLPPEEDKMEQLRRLDRSVVQKAQVIALTVGIVGILILGFGMSLAMTNLAEIFGSYSNISIVIGIILGVVGMGTLVMAYPIHQKVIKRERERIAPEVIRLANELMK